MIVDARVLREGFVPSELEHRDGEVDHLSGVLEPVTRGEPAGPAIITGPSGAGKTCVARYTVEQLREQHLDVASQYVNCWQNYSRFRTLYRVLEGLGKTVDIHRRSTPHDELLERLREYEGPPCVVVLDEADQLETPDALYDLHSLDGFSLVLIANREADLFAGADDRLASRLQGSERIQFDRYGLDELTAILRARARRGLAADAVTTDQLRTVADAAAGDARVAISILRSAARHAERAETGRITDAILDAAVPAGRSAVHRKNIETLTPHQRALYDVIAEAGTIDPSSLYTAYRDAVDDPKTDRTVRNYLSKMVQYDLVEAEGASSDRTYRVVDPTADARETTSGNQS
ncbi:Cdc6/Cdc18 family protein [Halorientalis salina]|uniref:Cdc6/Cdc18 family protein n=1 Tax=Halorientalis salina TaxID=2932266 RepID=UPI0010AD7371|nr:Cdc6/Cdc18 family protein [Halorientalis salina]